VVRSDAFSTTLSPSGQVAALGTLQGQGGSGAQRRPTPVGGVPVPLGVPGSVPTGPTTPSTHPAPSIPPPMQAAAQAAAVAPIIETLRQAGPPSGVLAAQRPWARLVAVNRDGTDGQSFPIRFEQCSIGRSEGEILFPEDRYLAPRHAQIEKRHGQIWLRALDELNGAYARIGEPTPLSDGDRFLFGKQVLRFEVVAPAERDAAALLQHGVMLFGTPPRPAWGRLRQLLTTGQTRDIVHLVRPEVTLGREDADLKFPDDEFMSRRHVSLTHRDGRSFLADLGSSNGTYLRLRGERELRSGDLLRVGDQLLRFEPL
jgi:pSer/pThr/pTyr-binding forkhead associated (FHA) protein